MLEEIKRYGKWPLSLDIIWLLVPLVGIVARLSVDPIEPYDYWWSLVMGRSIALSGTIPDSNMFLYTIAADTPFFNQPWLAQWLMYVLYELIGNTGLMLVRNAIVVLTWFGVLALALRRCADARIVGGFSLAIVVVGGIVFGVRTQMFAFLPFILTLIILVEVVEKRFSRRVAWALIPVVMLWANLHGTFILAPIMAGCVGVGYLVETYFNERKLETNDVGFWVGLTVSLGLGPLVNPQGFGLYSYVFNLVFSTTVSTGVSEWQPVDVFSGTGALVMGLVLSSLVILFLRRKSVRLWEALLFVGMTYLGMSSMRSLFWWSAVWLVVIPPHLEALTSSSVPKQVEQTRTVEGIIHAAMVAMLLLVGIGMQPGMPANEVVRTTVLYESFRHEAGAEMLGSKNSLELMSLLRERGYPGRIFHDQGLGGLLEYALTEWDAPQPISFVDQRIEMIPEKVWNEYFLISVAEQGWEEVIEKYEIETLILHFEDQLALIEALKSNSAWVEVWSDDVYHMFFSVSGAEEFTQWRSKPTEIDTVR